MIKSIELHLPQKWQELTQEQLRYVLQLLSERKPMEVKVLMILRFGGINIDRRDESGRFKCYTKAKEVFYLEGWQVKWLTDKLGFIDGYEEYGHGLDEVGDLRPVNELLHGVTFKAYLAMEKYYQGFLRHKDNTMLLERLGQLMYVTDKGEYEREQTFTEAERLNSFLWYSYIKKEFGRMFPNFLRPSSGGGTTKDTDIISQMNIQIRALTGGDITKEETIMNADCWRALTELDAKAKEAREMKEKMKKK